MIVLKKKWGRWAALIGVVMVVVVVFPKPHTHNCDTSGNWFCFQVCECLGVNVKNDPYHPPAGHVCTSHNPEIDRVFEASGRIVDVCTPDWYTCYGLVTNCQTYSGE